MVMLHNCVIMNMNKGREAYLSFIDLTEHSLVFLHDRLSKREDIYCMQAKVCTIIIILCFEVENNILRNTLYKCIRKASSSLVSLTTIDDTKQHFQVSNTGYNANSSWDILSQCQKPSNLSFATTNKERGKAPCLALSTKRFPSCSP